MGQRYLPDTGLEYVPIDVFPKIKRYIVEEKDVLISIVGTIGLVSVVDERFHLASQTENSAKLTGLDRIDALFLYYYLISSVGQNHIKQATVGAVQAKLPLYNIEKIPVFWPERAERERTVEHLCPLDDKIELNRQINQTLEQLAQTIFKSWFVDFEPVKAKIEAKAAGRDSERAAMCAISGKLEPELDRLPPEQYQQLAATAALFPDALVESELGLIPVGWEVKALPDVIEVNPKRSLKKGTIAPYLDMANVPTNSARAADVTQREFSSGSKFMNGDTLLARITPCLENGKTAYVDFLVENQVGWGSTEFIVFRPNAPWPEELGYLLCRPPEFRAFAISNMTGTSGRQRVPNDCFANYKIAVSSRETGTAFGNIVRGVMAGIKKRDEESRTLATLRDTLLPKLLSGELVVESPRLEVTA